MRRRFHFHGPLKGLLPDVYEIVCSSVAEGMAGLSLQLPELKPHPVAGMKRVRIQGFDTVEALLAPSDVEDVHVYPQLAFGKDGGLMQLITGTVLIVAGMVALAFGQVGLGINLITAGIMMVIGGVMMYLMPQPGVESEAEGPKSHYLSQVQNTVAIGTPIPVLYGEHRIGGHILSMNINSTSLGGAGTSSTDGAGGVTPDSNGPSGVGGGGAHV